MPSPYTTDAFATRVNFASAYISAGRNTTRHFDTCFEMNDGDAVAVAVYRRSRKNPKLRANLWRYLTRTSIIPVAFRERHRPTRGLPAWAAELRHESDFAFAMMMGAAHADFLIKANAAAAAGYSVREIPKEGFSRWQFVRPDGTASEEHYHEDSTWHFAFKDMAPKA